jgi:hypothetical protein
MTSEIGNCTGLAFTGLGYSVLAIVAVAIACLAVGVAVLGLGKRRGRRGVFIALVPVLVLVLAGFAVGGMAGSSSADAATPGCVGSSPAPSTAPGTALTVVQTSTITGLAPGVPAMPISGMSTNNGHDSIFVRMVVVRIGSVAKASHATAGSCNPSNYVVLNPQMSVNSVMPPRGSVHFTGATIGFNNRATNQDACKGATVRLIYEVYES